MPRNPNVQFGRAIKPVSVKDVQVGNVARLYHKNSTNLRSANITVGAEPVVLVAFGLKEEETATVYNVFGNLETPYSINGQTAIMSPGTTIQVLPIGGVYCLYFDGTLGDVVIIAYKMSAMDAKALQTVEMTNPAGVASNRPNVFLDGSTGIAETHEFTIGSIPWVFRAYGMDTQALELYAIFEGEETRVSEAGPVTISADNTTLVVNVAGQYKFKVLGESEGIVLVANQTVLNTYNTGIAADNEDGAAGVTYVGTANGIVGGPITGTGTISLSASVLAKLDLAASAVQPGDAISVLVNDVGYIDANDTIDGGNF